MLKMGGWMSKRLVGCQKRLVKCQKRVVGVMTFINSDQASDY